MKMERVLIWAAATIAVVALGLGLYLARPGEKGGAIAIGGPFHLHSQTGAIVDSEDLKGRPYAIFFGFTHCPEICPTTMLDMARLIEKAGPMAKDFRVYFVSVDPERDTPEVLLSYLSSFEPHMIGLTGSPDEIARIARDFRVYYKKVPTSGGDYTMDHSAVVYLMGADGKFVNALGYQEPEDRALAKLKSLIEGT
jgi:protein SCO1